jgi:fatty-acyl-CoA synthase
VLAIFAASTSGSRRLWLRAILSLVLPVALLAALVWIRSVGDSYPPVHDVSTDWTDPVAFSPAMIQARGADAYPIEPDPVVPPTAGVYMNRRVAEVNAETCPGAVPVDLPFSPDQAYARAKAALVVEGLRPVTDDPRAGLLEATATGFWLGFKQDLAVRVRPGRGSLSSRIDVRSTSRSGVWDFGANCQRVTGLVQALGGGAPDQTTAGS